MGAKKIPRALHRRLVFGRVAPETLREINRLKGDNFGRRVDRVVREWLDLKRARKLHWPAESIPPAETIDPVSQSSPGEQPLS